MNLPQPGQVNLIDGVPTFIVNSKKPGIPLSTCWRGKFAGEALHLIPLGLIAPQ